MLLRIIPINVTAEKVHKQLFPPDGDHVTWIRANNPDYPEFEACNVKLHLFHLEEDEWLYRSLTVNEPYKSPIREHLIGQNGFGDYDTVYIEVDMELLLLYTLKTVSIVRLPKGHGNPTIHLWVKLGDDTLIKDWIGAGMPEPWEIKK